ncbi:hypothetical protein T45_01400 [Streptomyces turgidiscabies]|nr:hypothetical protein T45_01400 [Streptomyces turgidiscabies]
MPSLQGTPAQQYAPCVAVALRFQLLITMV